MTILRQRQPTGHVNDVDSTSQQHRVPRGKSMPSENVICTLLLLWNSALIPYTSHVFSISRARILVQVTINRRLLIGRDGHLDQSEAYDIS